MTSSSAEETVTVRYKGDTYQVPLSYVLEHPGGPEYILERQNQDITEAFIDAEHSSDAEELLAQWRVQDDSNQGGGDKAARAYTMNGNETTATGRHASDKQHGTNNTQRVGRVGALVCLAAIAVLCAVSIQMWRRASR